MLTEKELDILKRRASGQTQQAIATTLGISQAAVSKFETNAHRKILEAEQLSRIVKRMGIGVEQAQTGERVRYGGGR